MKGAVFAALLALSAGELSAQNVCRHALALGLDVSGSVDAREYRLQIGGVAAALNSPAVRSVLLARVETPVELLVYEWSGPQDQALLLPWTRITDVATLDSVVTQLNAVERRAEATLEQPLG